MKKILMALCMTFVFSFGAYAGDDAFNQADTNKDGKIDRQEFERAVEKKFKSYDLNNDGVLDMSEIRDVQKNHKDKDVIKEFESMDTNKDSKVDMEEFKASAHTRFKEYDRKNNGYIEIPEVDYRTRYQDPGSIMKPFGGFYF
jgi:Ca2+-binding EF-hand superfamily protein